MSIVIALAVVLIVAALIANFYPKSSKSTLAQGEILTPETEVFTRTNTEVVIEPVVEVVETPKVEKAPKMDAKPKKKPQPKKKPTKAKTNA